MSFVSIVIIDFQRKIFLKNAIESVLRQNIDRNIYEIIVVKNYKSEIDRWLESQRVKCIYSEERSYGSKILEAMRLIKGDVIALLDDDDIFLENKLLNINHVFNEDSRLGYYHNFYKKINQNGIEISKRFWFGERKRAFDREVRHDDYRNISKLNFLGGDFNHSSITFRIKLLEGIERELPNVTGSFDTLLYFLCSAKGFNYKFTSQPLTGYRIHQSTSSRLAERNSRIEYKIKQLNNYNRIKLIIENYGNYNLTKLLNLKIVDTELSLEILSNANRRFLFRSLLKYSKFHFYQSAPYLFKGIIFLSFLILPRSILQFRENMI